MNKQKVVIYAMEYHSTTKRNEGLTHAMIRMNIMLSERSHERLHIVKFHLYEVPRIGKTTETESRLVVSRSGGGMVSDP